MCKNRKHIIFCTCNEKESEDRFKSKIESFKILGDKEEYSKCFYSWILERTIRKRTEKERSMIMGELVRPSKKLDEELTAELVVRELNEKAEFDFDYSPKDGDELTITLSYKYAQFENYSRPFLLSPMTFVYENKEWYFGYINHFEYKQEELKKGKITLHNNGYK
tara:strand:+ start:2710 stop:3204 length:495 start_codon:yes stop_codon:yes gene_type:complete